MLIKPNNSHPFIRWLILASILFMVTVACCATASGEGCTIPVVKTSTRLPVKTSATPAHPTIPSASPGEDIDTVTPEVIISPSGVPSLSSPPTATADPATSRLPTDVPIYPGAIGYEVIPGVSLSFFVPVSQEMVATYYQEKLGGAGWSESHGLYNTPSSPDLVIQYWRKGDFALDITLAPVSGGTRVTMDMMINP